MREARRYKQVALTQPVTQNDPASAVSGSDDYGEPGTGGERAKACERCTKVQSEVTELFCILFGFHRKWWGICKQCVDELDELDEEGGVSRCSSCNCCMSTDCADSDAFDDHDCGKDYDEFVADRSEK